MANIKISNITYKISLENLSKLVAKIKDLTKLDGRVLFRFDNDNLLIYSMVGTKNTGHIHGFKSHILEISDYFHTKTKLEEELKYSVTDANKLANSLTLFIKYMTSQGYNDDVKFKITYNEDFFGEKLTIQNSKSKEEFIGGDPTAFNQNIDIEEIEEVTNTELSDYNFQLSKADYNYIKSKSTINKLDEILYMNIKDNGIIIGESTWEHKICDGIEQPDNTLSFPKKYFKCIDYESDEPMKIYVFEQILLIVSETTNLIISIELSI